MLYPRDLLIAAAIVIAGTHAAGTANYTPNHHALRILMTDSTFLSLVTPCPPVPSQERRNVPAEWIRTAFHDAATYDASTGIGGIDGSLKYELTRPENGGVAIPETLKQLETYKMDGVSVADLTVLGAIAATLSCGGPEIPFRYGRADITSANAENLTPLPFQGAHAHAGLFRRMGFNTAEMIQLVACGHTLGGVHADVHPNLTNKVTATFDSTKFGFDNAVAVEFVNGTSANPLAVPVNGDGNVPGSRSDAEIYGLDGNKTISDLASSKKSFDDACSRVFSRMFDETVPRGTILSDPIQPYPVSVGFEIRRRRETFHLRIGAARVWKMNGLFKSINIDYYRRDGTLGPRTDLTIRPMRTVMQGLLNVVDFQTLKSIDPVTGISAVKVSVILNDGSEYVDTEGAGTFLIDDSVAIDTDSTFTCEYKPVGGGNSGLNITAGVLGDSAQRVYIKTKHLDGTLGPLIKTYYRRPRHNTPYSYYGVFIPDILSFNNNKGISAFAAVFVREDGRESVDVNNGFWFTLNSLGLPCGAAAIVPNDTVVLVGGTTTTIALPTVTTTLTTASDAETLTTSSFTTTTTDAVTTSTTTSAVTTLSETETSTTSFAATTTTLAATISSSSEVKSSTTTSGTSATSFISSSTITTTATSTTSTTLCSSINASTTSITSPTTSTTAVSSTPTSSATAFASSFTKDPATTPTTSSTFTTSPSLSSASPNYTKPIDVPTKPHVTKPAGNAGDIVVSGGLRNGGWGWVLGVVAIMVMSF
ncbi:heme peroxidase [Chytridium lagenaria]|nr:heme peroxidase [Chytridium lagenaria]